MRVRLAPGPSVPALTALLLSSTLAAQEIRNWPTPSFWSPSAKPIRDASPEPADASPLSAEGALPTTRLPFVAITPCRIVDTRPAEGFVGAYGPPAMVANVTRDFDLNSAPHCPGIAPDAGAYSLNVTVTQTLGPGDVRIWPTGDFALVSTQNWQAAGVSLANAAIVPAGTDGKVTVQVAGSNTHLIIDINGFYALDRITRSVSIPLTSFFDCQTSPHSLIDFTDGVDSIASLQSFGADGFGTLLSFDAVGGSPDQDSEVCSQLMVPADYVAGGVFRINADKNDHGGAQELLNCAVSLNSGPLGAVGTVEIDSPSPTQYVCSPSFGLPPAPGRSLAFYLSITSPGVMDDFVTISSVSFEYSSAK